MRTRDFVVMFALLLTGPNASAGFMWLDPNWQLTINLSTPQPPISNISAVIGPTNGDTFSGQYEIMVRRFLDGSSGGGFANGSISFARSFRIVETIPGVPVPVPFLVSTQGTHFDGTFGGGTQVFFSTQTGVTPGPSGGIFNVGGLTGVFDVSQTQTLSLTNGVYQYSGIISMFGAATSGGPMAEANFTMTHGVDTTGILDPTPVPAPSSLGFAFTGSIVLGVLRVFLLRGA